MRRRPRSIIDRIRGSRLCAMFTEDRLMSRKLCYRVHVPDTLSALLNGTPKQSDVPTVRVLCDQL